MEICPVCNKEVDQSIFSSVIDGVVYRFCCERCQRNFTAEPRKFMNCCEDSTDR
ncbi:MAG: YHS domain-containing protein [Candidatus Omnitrophica bacterium]|nr:YHS domain-containing protein [Candidatus Omnitrophota bacterium]MCB9720154.1 YHS domain-containing protein [Candidatus Omnitrophota bacterium]